MTVVLKNGYLNYAILCPRTRKIYITYFLIRETFSLNNVIKLMKSRKNFAQYCAPSFTRKEGVNSKTKLLPLFLYFCENPWLYKGTSAKKKQPKNIENRLSDDGRFGRGTPQFVFHVSEHNSLNVPQIH